MEVTLIAMTDAVMPKKENELVGEFCAAEHVCDHAARTCTSAKLEPMLEYEDTYLSWGHEGLGALKASILSGHTSILEHVTYTFEIKGVSRITEIQLTRHRIGAAYSIQSGRYCARDPTDYIIPFDTQGLNEDYFIEYDRALRNLDEYLKEMNICEEDRRYIYPQGSKTNIVCTFNARELRHIASLRMCNRAQEEIRELVTKMVRLVKEVSPVIFENVGPSCVMTGRCPEGKRSCGRLKNGQN